MTTTAQPTGPATAAPVGSGGSTIHRVGPHLVIAPAGELDPGLLEVVSAIPDDPELVTVVAAASDAGTVLWNRLADIAEIVDLEGGSALLLAASGLGTPTAVGLRPGQRVAAAIGVPVIAPDGLVSVRADGSVLVMPAGAAAADGGEAAWWLCRPYGPAEQLGPVWPPVEPEGAAPEEPDPSAGEDELTGPDEEARPETTEEGSLVSPLPSGFWIKDGGPTGVPSAALAMAYAGPDVQLAVLGTPERPELDGSVLGAALDALPELVEGTVFCAPWADPAQLTRMATGLAELLGRTVPVSIGLPLREAEDRADLWMVDGEGIPRWKPYVTELTAHHQRRRVKVTGWRAPLPGLRRESPAVYSAFPGWQLEAVPSGVWLRHAGAPADRSARLRPAGPDPVIVIGEAGQTVGPDSLAGIGKLIGELRSAHPAHRLGLMVQGVLAREAEAVARFIARHHDLDWIVPAPRTAVPATTDPATPPAPPVPPPSPSGSGDGGPTPPPPGGGGPASTDPLRALAAPAPISTVSGGSPGTGGAPSPRAAEAPPAAPVPTATAAATTQVAAPVAAAPARSPWAPTVAAPAAETAPEQPPAEPELPPAPRPVATETHPVPEPAAVEPAEAPGPPSPASPVHPEPIPARFQSFPQPAPPSAQPEPEPEPTAPPSAVETPAPPAGVGAAPEPEPTPEPAQPAAPWWADQAAGPAGPAVQASEPAPAPTPADPTEAHPAPAPVPAPAARPSAPAGSRLFTAEEVPAPERVSSAGDRAAVKERLGNHYLRHVSKIDMVATRLPTLRSSAAEDIKPDLVAVLLHHTDAGVPVNRTELARIARSGQAAGLGPYLTCLGSGLRRLPSYHGMVLFGGSPSEQQLDCYVPGARLFEPAPLTGLPLAQVQLGTPVEFAVWSSTGRRTTVFEERRDALPEVVFPPGTCFTVVDVVRPQRPGVPLRVLLRESDSARTAGSTPEREAERDQQARTRLLEWMQHRDALTEGQLIPVPRPERYLGAPGLTG
ncbi:hypothetical protein [Kitasatospora sp. NPDC093102]|uniref:hypothetical protein n=1 Tax=Kitasatospora sp. NPDC093102 TaxID=3155069 RepID=UPI003435CE16